MAFLTKNFGQKNHSHDLFAPYSTLPKCHSKQVMLDSTFLTNVFFTKGSWDILTNQDNPLH
jgi:hypothetical protein